MSAVDSPAAPAAAKVAAGSSFYAGMRVLPKPRREAMYAVYGFCRIVDDIADDQAGDRAARRYELDLWRADLARLYAGGSPGRAAMLATSVERFGLAQEDFLDVLDGMQTDVDGDVRAPSFEDFDLYCDRVASAVGRLSVRIFGMDTKPGLKLAHHLGRALQFTNVLRDLDEDAAIGRLYLPRELLLAAGIAVTDPATVVADARVDAAARALSVRARSHYSEADRVLATRPRGHLIAPRLMSAVYGRVLARTESAGWIPPRTRARLGKVERVALVLRHSLLA